MRRHFADLAPRHAVGRRMDANFLRPRGGDVPDQGFARALTIRVASGAGLASLRPVPSGFAEDGGAGLCSDLVLRARAARAADCADDRAVLDERYAAAGADHAVERDLIV